MVTPIWRPERRNRKIGTTGAGFRNTNEMRIPESWLDRDGVARPYHHRINPDAISEFTHRGDELTVLFETPREDCSYGCTPADVFHILSKVPASDREGLNLVAFRQPTRKQNLMNPVWGRLVYEADFGSHQGPAIVLEAIDVKRPIKWSRKLAIEDQKELQRLRDDGHLVEDTKREHRIHPVEPAIRQTMLYRTLLHEVGHWVHWLTDVIRPKTALSPVRAEAADLYFTKSVDERENFAHRFAIEQTARLTARQDIPFEPII